MIISSLNNDLLWNIKEKEATNRGDGGNFRVFFPLPSNNKKYHTRKIKSTWSEGQIDHSVSEAIQAIYANQPLRPTSSSTDHNQEFGNKVLTMLLIRGLLVAPATWDEEASSITLSLSLCPHYPITCPFQNP